MTSASDTGVETGGSTPRLMNVATCAVLVVILALVLARVAVWLQVHGINAFLLFPVLFGGVLGFGVSYVAARATQANRLQIVLETAAAALLMACAEHGFFYLDYRSQFAATLQSDSKAQLAVALEADKFQPATFYRFMAAEAPAKWLLWTFDVLAMIAIAALTAWLLAPG